MRATPLLSVVALVVALGAAGALATWGMQRETGDADRYPVQVVGPSGIVVLDTTVHVEAATVLLVLRSAAEAEGVPLELVEYPGMGTYVRAIGGHRAAAATGWIYEVQRDGAWISGDQSAAYFALHNGDATRWTWTDG